MTETKVVFLGLLDLLRQHNALFAELSDLEVDAEPHVFALLYQIQLVHFFIFEVLNELGLGARHLCDVFFEGEQIFLLYILQVLLVKL